MSNNVPDENMSPETVMEIASGFKRSRILLTACELDIFTALGNGARTSAGVAKVIETDQRATDRLMNALCAMDLLDKKDGVFANAPLAARFLVKTSPHYIVSLAHSNQLWDSWNTLTEAVRHGGTVLTGLIDDRGDKWLDTFIAAMHYFSVARSAEIVSLLDLDGVQRVLDVGGGSAAAAMAFVRVREDITAYVFDLPNVVPLTEKYIDEASLADKVLTVVGDYNTDELPQGFDLVLLSHILHANSSSQNVDLLRKSAESTNPGGQVVIQEFLVDDDRTSPPFSALFALNMLVATESGDTYTEKEITQWLQQAGLTNIKRKETTLGTSLIIAKRPE
jgi:SAM-dependent methyltransferase